MADTPLLFVFKNSFYHFLDPEDQASPPGQQRSRSLSPGTQDTHGPMFSWDLSKPQGIQCHESITTASVGFENVNAGMPDVSVSSQSSQHQSNPSDEMIEAPVSERASIQDMPNVEENMAVQGTCGRVCVKNGFLHFDESIGEHSPSRSHSAPPCLGRAFHSQGAKVTFSASPCQATTTTGVPADPAVNTGSGHAGEQEPIVTADDAHDASTTVMVCNLPSDLSRHEFASVFLQNGYAGLFDFVYIPMNFRDKGNFGHGFINFTSHNVAVQAMALMQCSDQADSENPLQVQGWTSMWCNSQGFHTNVERYRNSPLMHALVPEEVKPATYDRSGDWTPFPPPTRKIRPNPRGRFQSFVPTDGEHQIDESSQLHPGCSVHQPRMGSIKK